MENQPLAPKPKQKGSTFLIIALSVLLIGGGLGLWFFLRKGDDDQTKGEKKPNNSSSTSSGLTGREVSTKYNYTLPQWLIDKINDDGTELGHGDGNGPRDPNELGGRNNPVFIESTTAINWIEDKVERLQMNGEIMDIIRSKYDIGRILTDYGKDKQEAVDHLFGLLPKVNIKSPRKHLTFPIYGKYEVDGKGRKLRSELQNLLNRGWEGLTLAPQPIRDNTAPWWIESVRLNLLMGTTDGHVFTAFGVLNGTARKTKPESLQYFKRINSFWVEDKHLVKTVSADGNIDVPPGHPGAIAGFPSGSIWDFVDDWVGAIDNLEKVTRWEAIRLLQAPRDKGGDGYHFTFIDPDSEEDLTNEYNQSNSSTSENDDLLIP